MIVGMRSACRCCAVLTLLLTCGCGGRAVVPSSYETYKSDGGAFQILYPAGWDATGWGATFPSAKFTSGSAAIEVDTALMGSLLGDIAQAANNMAGSIEGEMAIKKDKGLDTCPARVVHDAEKEDFVQEYRVKEQEPVVFDTGFGDGRKSEFTGSRMGVAIHGCRVTTLSPDKRVRIVCRCSESQWDELKPVFDKVIKSLAKVSGS
jgi:hypothetical protein